MNRSVYQPAQVRMNQWADTPIVRLENPLTGLKEGDDAGYRNVRTLEHNPEDLVVPNVVTRPTGEGMDEYGVTTPANALPGGLCGGVTVVRETVARALDEAQRTVHQLSGGDLQVAVIDGFRSGRRQSAGFTRLFRQLLDADRISRPTIAEMYKYGRTADGVFAWVNPDTDSAQCSQLLTRLRADSLFMDEITNVTRDSNSGADRGTLTKLVDQVLSDVVTISVNSNMGPAEGQGVPLNFENNAHAGGGAVDLFLLDSNGIPLNIVHYDYVGAEAAMDYMENDGNYDAFCKLAVGHPTLMTHLQKLGYSTIEAFTFEAWKRLRAVNRIRYHLAVAMGMTYYSAHNGSEGGENWHLEPGVVVTSPENGSVLYAAPTAARFPNSGNPGHTLQRIGRDGIAVWGGRSAHRIAQDKFGLEM